MMIARCPCHAVGRSRPLRFVTGEHGIGWTGTASAAASNFAWRGAAFLLVSTSVWLAGPDSWADSPDGTTRVAGRTLEQYAADLDHSDRTVRLRGAWSLGVFGRDAEQRERVGEILRRSLDHCDAAIRYLASRHLGELGDESLQAARKPLERLARDDSSHAVRMAASFALCRLGRIDEHLPLLIESLSYPERGMVCSAAELIGAIGPSAKPALKTLQSVHKANRPGKKGGDYHIGGATINALRKIDPDAFP
jgi:hypothetical protein